MFNKRETKLEKSFNGRIQIKFSNNWEIREITIALLLIFDIKLIRKCFSF